MRLHPLCEAFPRLEGTEFDELVSDIKANGLRTPITVLDGMILDGGNRYRACIEAGVTPEFEEFAGADVAAFVISVNVHRRHFSPGQKATMVALVQDWAKAQPTGRPKNGDVEAVFRKESNKSDGKKSATVALFSDPASRDTAAKRATQSGASARTQKMADKVAKSSPDLAKKVVEGELSLPDALRKVEGKPPKEEKKDDLAEAFSDTNPVEEWERTQKELEAAQATIDSLTKDDTKAELKRQIDARKAVEQRLSAEMTRCGALDKELRAYGKWAKELREITGCESRSDITRAVRDAVRIAKDSVEL